MKSTIIHIPGPTEEARDRETVARLRRMHGERKRMVAGGRVSQALTNSEMVQRALAETETAERVGRDNLAPSTAVLKTA